MDNEHTEIDFTGWQGTDLTKEEILLRAAKLQKELKQQFPGDEIALQYAVDSVIDAAIEYAQGG